MATWQGFVYAAFVFDVFARRIVGWAKALFAEMNGQVDANGLVLKAGTVVDATLVAAVVALPPQREGEVSKLDPEAGFTRRGQCRFFAPRHTWSLNSAPTWCGARS